MARGVATWKLITRVSKIGKEYTFWSVESWFRHGEPSDVPRSLSTPSTQHGNTTSKINQ